jgi:hypothetical protein
VATLREEVRGDYHLSETICRALRDRFRDRRAGDFHMCRHCRLGAVVLPTVPGRIKSSIVVSVGLYKCRFVQILVRTTGSLRTDRPQAEQSKAAIGKATPKPLCPTRMSGKRIPTCKAPADRIIPLKNPEKGPHKLLNIFLLKAVPFIEVRLYRDDNGRHLTCITVQILPAVHWTPVFGSHGLL